MTRELRVYIEDILEAIAKIEEYVQGLPSEDEFFSNTQKAGIYTRIGNGQVFFIGGQPKNDSVKSQFIDFISDDPENLIRLFCLNKSCCRMTQGHKQFFSMFPILYQLICFLFFPLLFYRFKNDRHQILQHSFLNNIITCP